MRQFDAESLRDTSFNQTWHLEWMYDEQWALHCTRDTQHVYRSSMKWFLGSSVWLAALYADKTTWRMKSGQKLWLTPRNSGLTCLILCNKLSHFLLLQTFLNLSNHSDALHSFNLPWKLSVSQRLHIWLCGLFSHARPFPTRWTLHCTPHPTHPELLSYLIKAPLIF